MAKENIKLETNFSGFKKNLQNYLEESKDEFSRFKSWEHCYFQFQKSFVKSKVDRDLLCLWLAWYLASWGMLHNSKLLKNNYKIHRPIVDFILDMDKNDLKCLNNLKCQDWLENRENCQNKLSKLYLEIRDYYKKNKISATDTLITKVLLGTLGCVPAFDTLFKEGVCGKGYLRRKTLPTDYITALSVFYVKNKDCIDGIIAESLEGKRISYPQMKVLDMGFWNFWNKKTKSKKEA